MTAVMRELEESTPDIANNDTDMFAVVDVLGLDHLVETLLRALFDLGHQFGPVTDHVQGQLVDLVGDLADTVNGLFLGLPQVVGLNRGGNLWKFEL